MNSIKRITNFLFELNEAKRTPRSGWHREGIRPAESIAEHTAVCSQIAFVLAHMEGADPERAATLALFHDSGETRTGDEDWISRIYKNKCEAEMRAFRDQIAGLPMERQLEQIFKETKDQKTAEAIIAKDADTLELILQARVYAESGFRGAQLVINSVAGKLKTKTAKSLLATIVKSNIEDSWQAILAQHNRTGKNNAGN